MEPFEVIVADSRVTINFACVSQSPETLVERINDILPLLQALLSADEAWLGISDDEYAARARGWLAIDMMCKMDIQAATQRAKLLKSIADGAETIGDHGFPEFEDGESFNV